MELIRSFVLLISIGVAVSATLGYNETLETLEAPRPLRDRFRKIHNNAEEEKLLDEIEDFTAYACEKMVVIRNRAEMEFTISCQSAHETMKETKIQPGKAYAFTFTPQKNGRSRYWCTLEYHKQYAQFDVYNEDLPYMCPRDRDEIYQYVVHHDGIYVDKSKGANGQKIRALMKGHNTFMLWEDFQNGTADGLLATGFVDGGMCYDVPKQFNDKVAAVTICYNHCVRLYEHYGCQGKVQIVQANDDCHIAGLSEELVNKMSAIQGC